MAQLTRTLAAAALLAAFAAIPAHAEGLQLLEQKIKAGLIYNFLKYTVWPSEAQNGKAVVCLAGGDPFDGHLGPMAGRTVNQRTIEIKAIESPSAAPGCALLFIRSDRNAGWLEYAKALAGKDVLTVSDYSGFAKDGGMIEFTRVDNRIGVTVNMAAVKATRLEVQDRLLKLANAPDEAEGRPK